VPDCNLTPTAVDRRQLLVGCAIALLGVAATSEAWAQGRHFRIAFANQNEEPGIRLDGLGFTGVDVRRSFELAARTMPVDMIYYDNAGDGEKAIANADDAIERKVELFIAYNADLEANAEIGRRLRAAGIRALAVNYPVPGAPLYTADNLAAGDIAGHALGDFARQSWSGQSVVAVIVGDLGDVRPAMADRIQGIVEGLQRELPDVTPTRLDTSGNPVRVESLLGKFLKAQSGRKVLVAALDDATALAAKTAIEIAGRLGDCIIVSHGIDRSVHGGASDKKELDPNNRGSILLGSVAFFLDRYGYEVLPIALRMLAGEPVPLRIATKHILITSRNVFQVYPPFDMN
jgi:ABC-type sugar transport system substrate-binding protein